MYLKSIEVQGFKSFANKILFEFHNGITGIVGPNGSGKSNVADAVRWVLGEQRAKQLRGGNMQDVIFSGTENRKPLSYASVAITLDNSDHQLAIDFEEVTVARKIYRSGESEYLINGSPCRLKDVNELFYDTGIGKEGYSIIGQGQIDKILSGKPEERRELFDEAAGIVKFKKRKNMSVKKLEEERQNLVRVNDILAELEKQIGPLEKQSEVAREYLKKKESLKTYDINLFLLETERLKKEIAGVAEKLMNATKELAEATTRYENTKTEYEAIELKTDEIDAAMEKAKRQLNETTLLKQQLEGQIEVLKEQINTARMNDEHIEQRSKTIYNEMSEREKNLSAMGKDKFQIQEKLSEQEEQEKAAQQQLLKIQTKSAELTGAIDENQNQIMEILNNRTATKVKKQRYDSMMEQIQVRRSEMHQKLIAVESEASEHDELIAKFEAELQEIAQTISGYVTENKTYEEKIAALQQAIAKKNEQLRIGQTAFHREQSRLESLKNITERYDGYGNSIRKVMEKKEQEKGLLGVRIGQTAFHREQSRLESLKNITERYDGYGNSIRKVMEKKEQEKGLLGVVADLIKVDKAYEIAVETALGGSIQNIVTDNEETAKRMITFLKQNKFGRATFLPLTSINGTAGIRQNEALQEEGVIGLANTLVKVEEIYRGLADHLLGRTVVVKHIDHGVALAKKYKQTLRIVTLEGELINPGGAMTGGAFRNSSNLLSRRREIEEFEKTVEKLKSEMEQMEQEVEHEKEVRADYYSKIEVIKQQLQKAYVIQNTAKMNAEQVKAKKADAKAVSSKIHEEGAELERQIKEIRENHASIQVELETSEKLEQELTEQIASYQKELDQERERESKQLLESEKVHLAYAAMEQKYQFLLENEQRIQEEITKFNEELSALRANKGDASEEIRKKETQIEDIRLTIVNSKELFEEIQKEIASYSSQKEELTKKHKAFLAEREALSKHMSDLDKEAFRLNSQKEAFEQASEKQINYMWEEYELTYNMALKIKDENLTDLTFIKKQIQALKNEIRLLGNVNVNAIEDFKEVSERYAFLKNQHDDLIEAEATLKQIIEELDAAMRKQFRERFAEICVEFDKVFKQLFGGGKGTLELQEEEDILEAGIRIIAQPPGKKLQNMMQLSGGEKALTAISLLFAIQNLKPSPFCLLDEIEAALDDSNVDRYARYLHKLTKNTQFIVITHRRGTMTAADRLYGITMQEKGVSTLVSVDLLDKELTN